jgi:hypothetical protein
LFNRFIARIKSIPGISIFVGAAQLFWIFGPSLFRGGEHAQFALDLWREAGGDIPMLVQVVSVIGEAILLIHAGLFAVCSPAVKPVQPAVPLTPQKKYE